LGVVERKASHNAQFAGIGQRTGSVHLSGKFARRASRTHRQQPAPHARTHTTHAPDAGAINPRWGTCVNTDIFKNVKPYHFRRSLNPRTVSFKLAGSLKTKFFVTSFLCIRTVRMLRALSLSAAMAVASAFAPSLPAGGVAQRTSAVSGEQKGGRRTLSGAAVQHGAARLSRRRPQAG
jgi:hypothetical protein